MRYVFGFLGAFALGLMLSLGCGNGGGEGGSGGTGGTAGTGGMAGTGGTGGMAGSGGTAGTGGTGGSGGAGGTGGTIECLGLYVDGSCAVYFCEGAEDGTLCILSYYNAQEIGICIDGGCQERECDVDADCKDYKDCTVDSCLSTGICERAAVQDGTPCEGGACEAGECALQGTVLPCTEQGIRNAIAAGGGPYTFDCDGPTTVVTEAEVAIDNDVILDGGGNLTVDGNEDHRVFFVSEGVTAELHGFGVTRGAPLDFDGRGSLSGGGIYNSNGASLTLTDSTVSNNTTVTLSGGGSGGGIANNGTLTLNNTGVSDNVAYLLGGGIFNSGGGSLTLTNSTVSGNSATTGGGIWADGRATTLNHSTVSGNSATLGGGIAIFGPTGTLTLTNSTVSGNGASEEGSAIYSSTDVVIVASTVVGTLHAFGGLLPSFDLTAAVLDGLCTQGGLDVDVSWNSNGYNIESPGDTCGLDQATDQVKVTAGQLNLGRLQDNGGPTMTHQLLTGSVAIDKISEADCVDADGQPLTTDQRGYPRPAGTTDPKKCDVGAFELQPP